MVLRHSPHCSVNKVYDNIFIPNVLDCSIPSTVGMLLRASGFINSIDPIGQGVTIEIPCWSRCGSLFRHSNSCYSSVTTAQDLLVYEYCRHRWSNSPVNFKVITCGSWDVCRIYNQVTCCITCSLNIYIHVWINVHTICSDGYLYIHVYFLHLPRRPAPCVLARMHDSDLKCDPEGNYRPLQCRPINSSTTATPSMGKRTVPRNPHLCRCVDHNNGSEIVGTEKMVMTRSEVHDCSGVTSI